MVTCDGTQDSTNFWHKSLYVCIKFPLRTVNAVWEAQMFLLYLPFRCGCRLFRFLISRVLKLTKSKEKSLLKSLICCDFNEKEKVLNAVHDIQTSSLYAVTKLKSLDEKKHRKYVNSQNNLQINSSSQEHYQFSIEDNEMVESTNIDSDETIKEESVSSRKHSKSDDCCFHEQLITTAINNFFQTYFNKLRKQIEDINEEKSQYPDILINSNFQKSFFEDLNYYVSDVFVGNTHSKQNGNIDKLNTLTGLLNAENSQLKEDLNETNIQLNDVKKTTFSLNQKILNLELQLNQVKDILENIVVDRDTMEAKLSILSEMIEEEETYLNENYSLDDSYHELSLNSEANIAHESHFNSITNLHLETKIFKMT